MAETRLHADQIETTSFEDKVEIAIQSGEASDDVVHKSGDTITGDLTISGNLTVNTTTILDSTIINGNLTVNSSSDLNSITVNGDIKTTGGLQFSTSPTADPEIVMYRGGTGFAVLRRYGNDYTILQIWAPSETWFNPYEATLALVRGNEPNQEYVDIYNNGYPSETQYGIRMQKRGTGQYRDFVFDYSDGTTNTEVMRLKPDQSVNFSGNITVNGTINGVEINTNKVIIELRTSDPASPFKGQIWFRTDL